MTMQLHAQPVFNRKMLAQRITITAQDCQAQLISFLAQKGRYITLAVDSWTNVTHYKVYNVMLLYAGSAYYYRSIENNEMVRDTSAYIKDKLRTVLQELRVKKVNVIALVTDNESAIKSAKYDLCIEFGMVTVPCAAHTIQLILKMMIKKAKIQDSIDCITTLIESFRSNNTLRSALMNDQTQSGCTTILEMIQPNKTRWYSLHNAFERVMKLKIHIDNVARNHADIDGIHFDEEKWKCVYDIHKMLNIIHTCTNRLQSDDATLNDMYMSVYNIMIESRKWQTSVNKIGIFESQVMSSQNWEDIVFDAIKVQWEKHQINGNAIMLAHGLSGGQHRDGYIDSIRSSYDSRIDLLCNMYRKSCVHDSDDTVQLSDEEVKIYIKQQYNNQTMNKPEWGNISDNEPAVNYYTARLGDDATSILAAAAIAVLSIVPSEASVERSFSAQKDVHRQVRNCLSGEHVESEMMIRMNSMKLFGYKK